MSRKLFQTAVWLAVAFAVVVDVGALSEKPPTPSNPLVEDFYRDQTGGLVAFPKEQRTQALEVGYEPATREEFDRAAREVRAARESEALTYAAAAWIPLATLLALRRWVRWLRQPANPGPAT